MRQNRLITIFAYLLMIAGCMGIVFLISKVADTDSFPEETGRVIIEETPSPTDPVDDETERALQPAEPESKEEQNTGGRRKWYTARHRSKPQAEPEVIEEEEPKGPPRLILATDLHYMSPKLTDYGKAFEVFTARDDGKVERYSSELLDAFFKEVLEYRPSALILSGDLTVDGEKINHQELAAKLAAVQEEGVPVLVIPGNHDINNPNASSYIGDVREEAENITPEEFYEIYHSFGYDGAASRDENSLSYRYVLDDTHWLLMLDSCEYEPYNKVGGRIKDETYTWIREQYEAAKEANAVMIPVAHHNLMGESRVYPTECAIEGGEEIISILHEYNVPLYLSGHLHLQRIKQFQAEPGTVVDDHVTEAVTASLSIAPCQYGVIEWKEDESMSYSVKTVDVSGWARGNRLEDENLLNFDTYSEELVKQVVSDQIYKKIYSVPDDMKRRMADLYGQLNFEYCAGKEADKREVRDSYGYELWEKTQSDSQQLVLIEKMMADLKEDNTSWESGPAKETAAESSIN
ncbi:metallophosphoesterase [Clostridium sp. AM58-1XD]|uniref:metallophosphoesterase n=1 Tax=Clostridium sp. AM58-1XD TaxID=2292307 RepID=UPI000E4B1997|nr:metallophosphoesterase [Clostridium sp. AM58-1XD]RGZ00882.1 metallophosphoesterase [Clostridium sp. AM58-1XD]